MSDALPFNDRIADLSPPANTTVLAYDFELKAEQALTVIRLRNGVKETLVYGVDYVFPAGKGGVNGGTIQLGVASIWGDRYFLLGLETIRRISDFVAAQRFDSARYNEDVDLLTIVTQELRRDVDRAYKLEFGETPAGAITPKDGYIPEWEGSNLVGKIEADAVRAVIGAFEYGGVASAGNYMVTTTGPVSGLSITRSLRDLWRDAIPVTARMAKDVLYTDHTQIFEDLIEICQDEGIPAILVDGDYSIDGRGLVKYPVKIKGRNRAQDRLTFNVDPSVPGLFINASDVTIEDLTIRCHSDGTIANAQGNNATCITIGEWDDPDGLPAIRNIHLNRLALTRTNSSGSGYALAVMGRSKGIYGTDIKCIGGGTLTTTGRHAGFMLAHYGSDTDGVHTAAHPDYPLVHAKFDPGQYSHHPSNIFMRGLYVQNSSRLAVLSACYNVKIDGFEMIGGVDGGQILYYTGGDDNDTFAHPDDRFKVHTNISIGNGIARNLTGVGTGASSVFQILGYGASKQLLRDHDYTDPAYDAYHYGKRAYEVYRAGRPDNFVFHDIQFEGGPRFSVTDADTYRATINLQTFIGSVTFRNITSEGAKGNLSVRGANCSGLISFVDSDLNGGVEFDECRDIEFRKTHITVPKFPILQITLNGNSDGWAIGDTILFDTSGASGEFLEKVDDSANVVRVQMASWTMPTIGEDCAPTGLTGQEVASFFTHRNHSMLVTGEVASGRLAADVAVNDTEITLASRVNYYGLTSGPFTVGQTLTGATSGGTATILEVVTGPAAAGFPTTATEGYLLLSPPTKPFHQNETISDGTASAKASHGWVGSLNAVPIRDKTADFTAGQTLTGAVTGATRTVVSQKWTARSIWLYFEDAIEGAFTSGETVTQATTGASGTYVSKASNFIYLSNASGNFENGYDIVGATSGAHVAVTSRREFPANGVLTVTGGSGLLMDGEAITDGAGGAAVVKASTSAILYAVAYDAATVNMQVGEYVTGRYTGARGEVVAQTIVGSTGVLYLYSSRPASDIVYRDNEPLDGDLGGRVVANIPSGPVPAANNGGLQVALLPGDRIAAPNGQYIVTEYRRLRSTKIAIEAAGFASSSGNVVSCSHQAERITVDGDCKFSGGFWGVEIEEGRFKMEGGEIRDFGLYGLVQDPAADVKLDKTEFVNGGLARLTAHNASASTRALITTDGKGDYNNLKFKNNKNIDYIISLSAGTDRFALRNSEVADAPISGYSTIAPFSNGRKPAFERNYDANGAPLLFRTAWVPTLTFGGASAGALTVTQAWYEITPNGMLRFFLDCTLPTASGATGNASIQNLPYVPAINDVVCGRALFQGSSSMVNAPRLRTLTSGELRFTSQGTTNYSNLTQTSFPSGTRFTVDGEYMI